MDTTDLLKGIHKVTAKGRDYFYAWRGGPRIHAQPGTSAFLEELLSLMAPQTGDQNKFRYWIIAYKSDEEFTTLADRTKKAWLPWLDRIMDEFGDLSVKAFDRPIIRQTIRNWRNKWKGKPRTQDYAKQVLSRVLSFVVANGKLVTNPCHGIANVYTADRAELIWQEGHFAAYYEKASKELTWAVKLAALTGLRQGDLLRLCWTNVQPYSIEVRTSKKGRLALIPLTQPLRDLLAEIPKRATTILTNSRGLPWRGFNASLTKAMETSGLKAQGLHFHDLRGTAATNFYRMDLSIREIAEIMGWKEDRVERLINTYVKKDEILKDRIARMEQHANKSVKPSVKLNP